MNWQDAKNRRNLDEINEEGWPMNNDRRLVIQQAAEQAAAKHPELGYYCPSTEIVKSVQSQQFPVSIRQLGIDAA